MACRRGLSETGPFGREIAVNSRPVIEFHLPLRQLTYGSHLLVPPPPHPTWTAVCTIGIGSADGRSWVCWYADDTVPGRAEPSRAVPCRAEPSCDELCRAGSGRSVGYGQLVWPGSSPAPRRLRSVHRDVAVTSRAVTRHVIQSRDTRCDGGDE